MAQSYLTVNKADGGIRLTSTEKIVLRKKLERSGLLLNLFLGKGPNLQFQRTNLTISRRKVVRNMRKNMSSHEKMRQIKESQTQ